MTLKEYSDGQRTQSFPTIWRRNSPPRKTRPICVGFATKGSTSLARIMSATCAPSKETLARRGGGASTSTSVKPRAPPMIATSARSRPAASSRRSANCSRKWCSCSTAAARLRCGTTPVSASLSNGRAGALVRCYSGLNCWHQHFNGSGTELRARYVGEVT